MGFKKFKRYIRILLGLPKSLYLSIKYTGFFNGLTCPILVTIKTKIKSANGKILFHNPIKFGILTMGFSEVAMSSRKDWNVWNVSGTIILRGRADFGIGSRLVVGKNGILEIGDNFLITAKSDINCFHRIIIGKNVLFSWDILVMDTDAHPIRDQEGNVTNNDSEIVIGDNCWIGSRTVILKNTVLKENSVVGCSSLLNKNYEEGNVIIAGNPGKIVKRNIIWKRESFKY